MRPSYTMIVERDPDSGWLVGEVVELPGCYTQAADLRSLERNIREAVKAYLKAKPKSGRGRSPSFVGTWRIEVPA